MGPVIFITGNSPMPVGEGGAFAASMGPVIFITGNARLPLAHPRRQVASMGPVIFITENFTAGPHAGRYFVLQWGR